MLLLHCLTLRIVCVRWQVLRGRVTIAIFLVGCLFLDLLVCTFLVFAAFWASTSQVCVGSPAFWTSISLFGVFFFFRFEAQCLQPVWDLQ